MLIGPGIFPHIHHVGSTINLYSIVSNGLILGGQNLSRRQTVFFLPVDPRNEDHKDPEYIDFSAPRLARYLQNAWKRHQDAVFWVDIDLGISVEGLYPTPHIYESSLIHIVSHRTVAQVRLARVIPSMHMHLCVALWWLFSSPVSFSSPFRCSSSGPSRCLPPSSTRSSSPKTCATSAWGPWPVLTTRHPSQSEKD